MKTHKPLLALTLALLLLLPLAACRREQADSLTLMGKESDLDKSYIQKILRLYEDSTGRELRLISIEDAEYETRAAELFEKGQAPDIFLHFNNADLNRFSVEDNFLRLNDQPWVDGLTDGARAYCQDAAGNLLGLPFWENSVSGCYYNKTLLDNLGLRPATTQEEFDQLCQVLTQLDLTPICWPADGCSWMFQFGLDPLFADDPALLDALNSGAADYAQIPGVTDMVRWIRDAAESGWFGGSYLRTGWSDIGPALASGGAVMTFIWDSWFYTDFRPDVYSVDDFALMPVFMNTQESGTYEGGNLNMMMVNKNSARLEEALDFLAFCADPENYNAAFAGISTVPCFKEQTTSIQSPMVLEASASVQAHERVSTAASRIVGYSADDMAVIVNRLLRGEIGLEECVAQMDASRRADAVAQGKS